MKSEHSENLRLIKALQNLKIDPKREGYISFENVCCTIRLLDTTPVSYEAARITQPGYKDMLIIDDGKKVHYRMCHWDGQLIKTSLQVFEAVFQKD